MAKSLNCFLFQIVLVANACVSSLARASDCLVPYPGGDIAAIGRVDAISEPDRAGMRLVASAKGLFRFAANGRLVAVTGAQGIEGPRILSGSDRNGTRLIGAANGLFRFRANYHIEPVLDSQHRVIRGTLQIFDTGQSGQRLVSTGEVVYLVPAEGSAIPIARSVFGSSVFTNSERTQQPKPLLPQNLPEIGYVYDVAGPDRSGFSLLAADSGLFRFGKDGHLVLVPGGGADITGGVTHLYWATPDGRRVVGAKKGTFRLGTDGRLVLLSDKQSGFVTVDHPANYVDIFYAKLGQKYGLVRLANDGHDIPVEGSEEAITGTINDLIDLDGSGVRLVPSEKGLFVVGNDGPLSPVPGGSAASISYTSKIFELGKAGLWLVAADNGLFRYAYHPSAYVSAVRRKAESVTFTLGEKSECVEFSRSDDFGLEGENHKALGRARFIPDRLEVVAELDNPPIAGRPLTVFLTRKDRAGRSYRISGPVEWQLPVDWQALSIRMAVLLAGLHTAFFLAAMVCANRSERAAGILMHPLANKLGLWWAWAVQYSPTLQRWLLGGWFRKYKAGMNEREEVLPLVITDEHEREFLSDTIVANLDPTCRIWLQGNPGMGKTAILRQIEQNFFSYASLAKAFDAFGFIPLRVSLRMLSDPGKGDRDWATRVAEVVLSGQGFLPDENTAEHNLELVSSILRRSGFVLMLDGANEVTWQGEIASAAAAVDRPGFFVTSQAPPPVKGDLFNEWRLPPNMTRSVHQLLQLHLGEQDGDIAYSKLNALLPDLKSGFDVRLVESLHYAGVSTFPESRIELYQVLVARLFTVEKIAAKPRLFALAWAQWLGGVRQFTVDDLDTDIGEALESDGLGVTRLVEGSRREFRHDQMRGFLAASHVIGAVNPIGLIAHCEAVWPRAASEQDLVWQFLFELAPEPLRRKIYYWSLEKPEDRIRLQVAFASERIEGSQP